jgi:pimeloyl-ACP methyl ester carboxylesterase
VKLAYLDLSLAGAAPAVLLHREGAAATKDAVAFAQGNDLFGRTVVPTGEYAFYPSGMTVGGTCWYRILPGFDGTDPISLTTAVVEVADLLDDLALDRPVLLGWGQGAVVALGAGLWRAELVRAVVCVDAPSAHIELLPAAVLEPARRVPVLLAAAGPEGSGELARQAGRLAGHQVDTTTWCWQGEGTQHDLDQALADQIGRWMDHE